MSWRTVVISKSAKLDYQLGYMVVRQEETSKIHISEIHMLIIETTAVSITAVLMSELVKSKVKVIFCDEKRNPLSELMPYYGSHDTSSKLRSQIKWDNDTKKYVWTAIVKEKIIQQAFLLDECGKDESGLLYKYVEEIEFGDSTNREGHAAKVYFNALFGKSFTRGTDCLINAALDYGYSILLSSFTREIVASGYLTQLGLFHDNMFNQFNLASDLMEPFRVLIDRKIVNMNIEEFGSDEKRRIVSVLSEPVCINYRNEIVSNAIKIYCKSIFESLENNSINDIKFYRYEL